MANTKIRDGYYRNVERINKSTRLFTVIIFNVSFYLSWSNKHLKTETEFLTFSVGKWRLRRDLSVRRPSTPGLQKMFTGNFFSFSLFRFQFIFSRRHTKFLAEGILSSGRRSEV
jgi:hypothetical protein